MVRMIFAQISCASLEISAPWYEKLFGMPPTRRSPAMVEWHFTDSAEVRLAEDETKAIATRMTRVRRHRRSATSDVQDLPHPSHGNGGGRCPQWVEGRT
jgi:hypothetical protein